MQAEEPRPQGSDAGRPHVTAVVPRLLDSAPFRAWGVVGRLLFEGWGWWFEVVVLLGFLFGVDVGWGDEPGRAGAELDGPPFFVDEVVVVLAEECAVSGGGGAAV